MHLFNFRDNEQTFVMKTDNEEDEHCWFWRPCIASQDFSRIHDLIKITCIYIVYSTLYSYCILSINGQYQIIHLLYKFSLVFFTFIDHFWENDFIAGTIQSYLYWGNQSINFIYNFRRVDNGPTLSIRFTRKDIFNVFLWPYSVQLYLVFKILFHSFYCWL